MVLHLVVDPSFQSKFGTDWKNKIFGSLGHVNWLYQKADMTFFIGRITTADLTRKGKTNKAYFGELEVHKKHVKADLHVGILSTEKEKMKWLMSYLGQARYFRDTLVVNAYDTRYLATVLAHEIGHAFGGIHTKKSYELMYPNSSWDPWKGTLGSSTKQILEITKCMDLQKSVDSLSKQEVALLSDIYKERLDETTLHPISWVFHELSREANERKNIKEEKRLLERAITAQDWLPNWRVTLGYWYFGEKQYKEALETYQSGLTLAQKLPKYDFYILTRGLEAVDTITWINGQIAHTKAHLGDIDEAFSIVQPIVEKHKNLYLGYVVLSDIAGHKGQKKLELQYLQKAVQLDPDNKSLREDLARIEKEMNKPKNKGAGKDQSKTDSQSQ